MTELLKKQGLFCVLLSEFIKDLTQRGYLVTMGECWRSPETAEIYAKEHKGIVNSVHCLRLACDLNIFTSAGKQLVSKDDYKFAGEIWKSYGEMLERCNQESVQTIWGGDFQPNPDADHFSIGHQGIE